MENIIDDNWNTDLLKYIKDHSNKAQGITKEIEKKMDREMEKLFMILEDLDNGNTSLDYNSLAKDYGKDFCQFVKGLINEEEQENTF